MKEKVCIFLLLLGAVVIIIVSIMFDYNHNKSEKVQSTYKIAHKDAKDLLDPGRDYLIVVNNQKAYSFAGSYEKELQDDLVYFPNAVDGDIMAAEKAAYLAFTSLQYELKNSDGIEIALYDGYRTAEDQEFINSLYDDGSSNVTNQTEAGYSEHHTGLLLDVVIWFSEDGENYEWYSPSHERLATIPEFKTVYKKMVDYGFIMRYPDEKSDITGMKDKEYEIRFVGSAEVAHKIMDSGLCLEEYVDNN